MKKFLVIGGVASPLLAMADTAYPDPTSTVTAMGTLFGAIGVIALAALAWQVGSRFVRKYLK